MPGIPVPAMERAPSRAKIEAVKPASYSDASIAEIIANATSNMFANVINEALKPTSTSLG